MLRRVVLVVVDAQHHGEVLVGGRRGDDDLLGTAVDVRLRLLRVGEEAGRLDDDVDAEVGPGQRLRVALGEDLDLLAADGDAAVGDRDVLLQAAQDRVVLQQVGRGRVVGEVVGGDHLEVGAGRERGAEEVATDAAEAVDADANSHAGASWKVFGVGAASSPLTSSRPYPPTT
ncbi:hypothetical protein GCM10025868_02640 [Angustibacter aerolatus]|uniref:Uncharacterized protein n=1 Tax=Angustibacter aerolatus TaxID=1162965 RepID=A0ABQ6JC39_9ACTN|nr:hypothetical protein GCM10025868_02640 [Angustibacter aerolatus]